MRRFIIWSCFVSMLPFLVAAPGAGSEKPLVYAQSGNNSPVHSLLFSKDVKYLVSFSDRVVVWEADSGRSFAEFGLQDTVPEAMRGSLGFRSFEEGSALARAGETRTDSGAVFYSAGAALMAEIPNANSAQILIKDPKSGRVLKQLGWNRSSLRRIRLSADEKTLYSGDTGLEVWDTGGFQKSHDAASVLLEDDRFIATRATEKVQKLFFREEKEFFSIADTLGAGTLKIPIGQLPQYSRLFAVAPGRDKLLVGVFGEKNVYTLLDATTLKAERTFAPEGLGWQMGSVCFSRDGSRIALKAEHIDAQRQRPNDMIHVYNVASGERIGTLSPPGGTIFNFRCAPSGDTLFVSEAEAVHWMDTTTGAVLKTFAAGSEKSSWSYSLTSTICLTRDAELLAMGDYNGTIHLWDVRSGKLIRTLPNQGHYVSGVLITSDKKRVWSVGRNDGTVRVADIATGTEIARFISFMDGQWVVITPEGFYNASRDGDKYLNVRLGMEIFGIENFRKTFFRPELVKQALMGGLR